MKNNEILSALRLQKSKNTMAYCSKLASLFTFLSSVKAEIKSAEIKAEGLSITNEGKAMDGAQIIREYRNSRLNNYRHNDNEVSVIDSEICALHCSYFKIKDSLWKKRKNKDNSELETELENSLNAKKEAETKKEVLLTIEENRLQSIEALIDDMRKELQLFEGYKISVNTNKGNYSFILPINNKFYSAICSIIGIASVLPVTDNEILHTLQLPHEVTECIKKALTAVSKDDLRPAMTCICLDIKDNFLTVVSTDAHRMYYSCKLECKGQDGQYLIPSDAAKMIVKVKRQKNRFTPLNIFSDNKAEFAGVEFTLHTDNKFPNYTVVIPEYESFMTFDKGQFVKNVKALIPYCNKSTRQINMHLNGSIGMMSQDVDFSFEGGLDMPYINKNFVDTDIAFNGGFLVDAMGIFKDTTVKMYSEGQNTKAAIFTNDNDTVLLMPLMINN